MAIAVTDLTFVHSGGATNDLPANDLGGIISSATYSVIKAQTASNPVQVTGVLVKNAFGNAEGNGSLYFANATKYLAWKPYGGASYNGINLTQSGTYIIGASNGYLEVQVTFGSLPTQDKTDTLTIANNQQNLFPHVSGQQSLVGRVDYRCVYVSNKNATDTAVDVRVWLKQETPGGDSLEFGFDPVGKGNGSTTGVATTIINGTTAPAGVTFSAPASYAAALAIGNLLPLQSIPLWIRRTVPAETRGTVISNTGIIAIAATI